MHHVYSIEFEIRIPFDIIVRNELTNIQYVLHVCTTELLRTNITLFKNAINKISFVDYFHLLCIASAIY